MPHTKTETDVDYAMFHVKLSLVHALEIGDGLLCSIQLSLHTRHQKGIVSVETDLEIASGCINRLIKHSLVHLQRAMTLYEY